MVRTPRSPEATGAGGTFRAIFRLRMRVLFRQEAQGPSLSIRGQRDRRELWLFGQAAGAGTAEVEMGGSGCFWSKAFRVGVNGGGRVSDPGPL